MTYTPETLSPNQFTEGQAQGLSAEEALAIAVGRFSERIYGDVIEAEITD